MTGLEGLQERLVPMFMDTKTFREFDSEEKKRRAYVRAMRTALNRLGETLAGYGVDTSEAQDRRAEVEAHRRYLGKLIIDY